MGTHKFILNLFVDVLHNQPEYLHHELGGLSVLEQLHPLERKRDGPHMVHSTQYSTLLYRDSAGSLSTEKHARYRDMHVGRQSPRMFPRFSLNILQWIPTYDAHDDVWVFVSASKRIRSNDVAFFWKRDSSILLNMSTAETVYLYICFRKAIDFISYVYYLPTTHLAPFCLGMILGYFLVEGCAPKFSTVSIIPRLLLLLVLLWVVEMKKKTHSRDQLIWPNFPTK